MKRTRINSDSVDDTHIYSSVIYASTIQYGPFLCTRQSECLKLPLRVYSPPAIKFFISVPRLRMRPTFKPDAGGPDPFTVSYIEFSTLLFMTLLHNVSSSLTRFRITSKSCRFIHKTLPSFRVGLTRTFPQQPPRWRLYATTAGLHLDPFIFRGVPANLLLT